jgi:4-diphosphocytidyl-2-C-methyl-D-erythritol kinase
MITFRSASGIRIQAPAKLNLFFEVLGKRSDGFHEIETLMAPIGLYDELVFEASTDNVEVDCHWSEPSVRGSHSTLGDLPSATNNLATRAVMLLRERAGVEQGARIRLVKRIPAAAGLGGGSSDAAAALIAANLGWGLGWSRARLSELAATLGSDVPFFLAGGPAICRGRGERIEPIAGLGEWHAVVVRPPVGLSTREVYERSEVPQQPATLEPLMEAMRNGNLHAVGKHLQNRLEPAAAQLSSWINRLRDEFRRVDCPAAQMSGSGSSYFGLFRSARQARRAGKQLAACGVGRVFVVQISGNYCS